MKTVSGKKPCATCLHRDGLVCTFADCTATFLIDGSMLCPVPCGLMRASSVLGGCGPKGKYWKAYSSGDTFEHR